MGPGVSSLVTADMDPILRWNTGHDQGTPGPQSSRQEGEHKAPRLELTLYNVYITAHGVRVIRPECSNTKSAHFQLNNEIALKRDGWVFVLCQVKVWVNRSIRPKVVTSIQIVGQSKDICRIRQILTYFPFLSSCDHGYRDSVVSPRPWQGQCLYWCSDHWHWHIASDIGVYWGYSLHIPEALSTTGDPTQVHGINDTSAQGPITPIVTPGRSTSNIFVKNRLGMSVSKSQLRNIIWNYPCSSFSF